MHALYQKFAVLNVHPAVLQVDPAGPQAFDLGTLEFNAGLQRFEHEVFMARFTVGGNGFCCRTLWTNGHRRTGHILDQLFDQPLAVLVGPDEIAEGLAAVDEHPGTVKVSLGLAQIGVEHGIFFLQLLYHLRPVRIQRSPFLPGILWLFRHRLCSGRGCRFGRFWLRNRFQLCRHGCSWLCGLRGRLVPRQHSGLLHGRFLRQRRQLFGLDG